MSIYEFADRLPNVHISYFLIQDEVEADMEICLFDTQRQVEVIRKLPVETQIHLDYKIQANFGKLNQFCPKKQQVAEIWADRDESDDGRWTPVDHYY